MVKVNVLDVNGKKTKEITTSLFEEPIREDIIFKVIEAEKTKHPNAPRYRAGMDISASGALTKRRHVWKSDRGRGLSRLPRKIMSRRGTQFNWIGAVVPSTRGGRRAHPPKGSIGLRKINKKELKKALLSALTYSASVDELQKKYSTLQDKKVDKDFPLIVEAKILGLNTKQFLESLNKILGKDLYSVAVQERSVRAGIGKMRGRRNKKNAGLLLVVGNKEDMKVRGIDILRVNELTIRDLADNGARLCMFTEAAVSELEAVQGKPEQKIDEEKPKKKKAKSKKKTEKKKIKKSKRKTRQSKAKKIKAVEKKEAEEKKK